jgi:hypothetical protein
MTLTVWRAHGFRWEHHRLRTSTAPQTTGATRPTNAPTGDNGDKGGYGPVLRGERQVVIPAVA